MQYNNIGISGTHFILRIQYKYTQTQYKDGARHVTIVYCQRLHAHAIGIYGGLSLQNFVKFMFHA